jgi:hypothetical protein
MEHRGQIDGDDPVPILGLGIEECCGDADTGVVDQERARTDVSINAINDFTEALGIQKIEYITSNFNTGSCELAFLR